MLLPQGWFTPRGTVNCAWCVARKWTDEVEVTRGEYEARGRCDGCSRDVWVRADVAALQAVSRALEKRGVRSVLQQTGGMCVALLIRWPGCANADGYWGTSASWVFVEDEGRYGVCPDFDDSPADGPMGFSYLVHRLAPDRI